MTAGRKYTFLAFVYLQQLSEGLTLELRLTAQKDGSVLARKALVSLSVAAFRKCLWQEPFFVVVFPACTRCLFGA
mgnify:CR=1 FL=1